MQGCAKAPAGGTILMAFPTEIGAAFAIDEYIHASVELTDEGPITGEIQDVPNGDTRLIERCAELVINQYGSGQGAVIETHTSIDLASGLKSSSAASNATILATLNALNRPGIEKLEAAKLGVQAAQDTGVTVTGAFDDASSSMLGGVTLTDNSTDELLLRDEIDWNVLVWSPPTQSFSSDVNLERCHRVAALANLSQELITNGKYELAMTVNGFAACAALDYPTNPLLDGLAHVKGVTLSGSGPSFIAVGPRADLERVQEHWAAYPGETWFTTTQFDGATFTE